MFSLDNYKAFKVSAATKKRWAEMTDRNDHQGVNVEVVRHILKGLQKIHSPLDVLCEKILAWSACIKNIRDARGLTSDRSIEGTALVKMAIALVETEAFEAGVKEIKSALE